jgi:hypothetical protein
LGELRGLAYFNWKENKGKRRKINDFLGSYVNYENLRVLTFNPLPPRPFSSSSSSSINKIPLPFRAFTSGSTNI